MQNKYCFLIYFSELKDSLSGDVAESDASELLKALLAKDPAVFKGGTTAGMYCNTCVKLSSILIRPNKILLFWGLL